MVIHDVVVSSDSGPHGETRGMQGDEEHCCSHLSDK